VREKLEAEWDTDDGWTLYDRLVAIDPDSAKNFQHQNKRYVVRAMELYELTGVQPSKLKKTIPPPYDILQLGLQWPRDMLTQRIDERTKILVDSGWIEEVESLLDQGYTAQDPGMKSHGYREIIAWLSADEQDRTQLISIIAAKTRQYAKRQMTWWGNDERIRWIDARQL
jgi:tRNA dimethylallyltransferase